jgi:hypothetical protein
MNYKGYMGQREFAQAAKILMDVGTEPRRRLFVGAIRVPDLNTTARHALEAGHRIRIQDPDDSAIYADPLS